MIEETFTAPFQKIYTLRETTDSTFEVLASGCRINNSPLSLSQARDLIYDRIFGGMLNDIEDATRRINALDICISSLKTGGKKDVFNLAKLKV
jgi:hypothetical protein